jgi:hypothetical protein
MGKGLPVVLSQKDEPGIGCDDEGFFAEAEKVAVHG